MLHKLLVAFFKYKTPFNLTHTHNISDSQFNENKTNQHKDKWYINIFQAFFKEMIYIKKHALY